MKELRQQTLKGILEQHPSKVVVIRAALEKMIDERIAEHVKQALSSADIEELSELLECIPAPVAEEALPETILGQNLAPNVEAHHDSILKEVYPEPMLAEAFSGPSPVELITEPKVTGKEATIAKPHSQKKKDKRKNAKAADLLD